MQESNSSNDTESHFLLIKGKYYGEKCLPSLNNMISEAERNPMAYNRLKRQMQTIIINAIRLQLRGWKTDKRVQLYFTFGEPKKGAKRDFDNVSACGHKYILDSLVKAGVIHDDSPKYVLPSVDSFCYTDETPFIKVEIRELGGK